MYHETVLFIILLLQICKAVSERDLFLTPKENLAVCGRTIYYNPSINETNGTIPWEHILKHVSFLTIFAEAGKKKHFSKLREYKEIMHAPYTRVQVEYPTFGDIITIARGCLENSNGYRFKEGMNEEFCPENDLAMWKVQKIRHRDSQRGFRFDLKFSVTPQGNKTRTPKINKEYLKTFILKDDEYPKNFFAITRRSDNVEKLSNKRKARIVNHKDSDNFTGMPQLNIGEYLNQIPKASQKISYQSKTENDLPTTYRPNYRVKFASPQIYEAPEASKTIVTHHFHHHYFMNDVETASNRGQELYNENPIRIVAPPKTNFISTQHASTANTTERPLQPTAFYMQQTPSFIQWFDKETDTHRPFRQSQQQFEEIRYSEPDPLYEHLSGHTKHNIRAYKNSQESASAEIQLQVEPPSFQPLDSVIEHVSMSDENQTMHDPHDDDKRESTTVESNMPLNLSTRKTLLPTNKFVVTPPVMMSLEIPMRYASRLTSKTRNHIRSTTEQPILKWKPKQKEKEKVIKPSFSLATPKTYENKVITNTPSATEFEILTQKSVSKSISVKVGNRSQEIPLVIKATTNLTVF